MFLVYLLRQRQALPRPEWSGHAALWGGLLSSGRVLVGNPVTSILNIVS